MTDVEKVEVTQADREAAADYLDGKSGRFMGHLAIRHGDMDYDKLVQAFARHRASGVRELVEGIERVLSHPSVNLCCCERPGCLTHDLRTLVSQYRGE